MSKSVATGTVLEILNLRAPGRFSEVTLYCFKFVSEKYRRLKSELLNSVAVAVAGAENPLHSRRKRSSVTFSQPDYWDINKESSSRVSVARPQITP